MKQALRLIGGLGLALFLAIPCAISTVRLGLEANAGEDGATEEVQTAAMKSKVSRQHLIALGVKTKA